MDIFSNRELAVFVWIGVLIIWFLSRQSARQSLFNPFQTAFAIKLSIIYVLMLQYTSGIVYFLHRLHLWDCSQLKNTIFWFFTVGLVSFFDITNENKNNYFKSAVKNIFNFTAILQFIIGIYSFNFFIELLLVPLGVLIIGIIVVGEKDPKNALVVRLLNNLLSLFGLFLICYTLYRIIKDFYSFANKGTLSDYLIPATLSILFLPLIYLLSLYVNREDTFIGLNRTIKSRKLFWHARWLTLIHFNFNEKDLRRWRSVIAFREIRTKNDVRNSIFLIKELKRVEKNPPSIPFGRGWSPYKAKGFLAAIGIETRYYHPYFEDDGWSASSSYINIKESKFLDNIAYYVEGNRTVARKLKLVLNVYSAGDSEISHEKFLIYAKHLYQSAMNKALPEAIDKAILKGKNLILNDCNRTVTVSVNKWQEHIRHGYNVDFSIAIYIDYK